MIFGLLGGLIGGEQPPGINATVLSQIQNQIATLTTDVQNLMQQAESLGSVPQKLIEFSTTLTILQNNFINMQQQDFQGSIEGLQGRMDTVESKFGKVEGDISTLQEQYTSFDALRGNLTTLRDEFNTFISNFPTPQPLLPTGVIRVSMVDKNTGAAIPNADVNIAYNSTTRTKTTDVDGQAEFLGVPIDTNILIRTTPRRYYPLSVSVVVRRAELKGVKVEAVPIARLRPPTVKPIAAPRPITRPLVMPREFMTVEPIVAPQIATPTFNLQRLDMADNSSSIQTTNQVFGAVSGGSLSRF